MAQFRERFVFGQMREASQQIRLFSFASSGETDQLSISLQTFDMDTAPPYVALSYAWGESEERRILVNGKRLLVRPNCEYALRLLCRHKLATWCWVDAICINQADNVEKGPQVSVMGIISVGAEQVAVCYGEDTSESEWLMQILRSTWESSSPPSVESMTGIELEYSWSSLIRPSLNRLHTAEPHDFYKDRLFRTLLWVSRCDYWGRLWIIQEILLSRRCTLLSSSGFFQLSIFTTFAVIFVSLFSDTRGQDRFYVKRLYLKYTYLAGNGLARGQDSNRGGGAHNAWDDDTGWDPRQNTSASISTT